MRWDVLEVYQRQYGDNEVLVCLDETSKQQVKETRRPRPARPGAAGSYDYEYERNGVSNLFMLFAPLEGWRRVEVTDRRTKADWARVVKQLVDEDYPHKDRIVLVMDNLNTHHPASLYEAGACRSAAHRRTVGGPLHSQAWQLAGYGRDRNRGDGPAMPEPPYSRPKRSAAGGGSVAATAQPGRNTGGLALHHLGCPHQAQVPLPTNTTLWTKSYGCRQKPMGTGPPEQPREDCKASLVIVLSEAKGLFISGEILPFAQIDRLLPLAIFL